jgi:hypothetical protein
MKEQLLGGCAAVETRCIASPYDGKRRRPAERACPDCFASCLATPRRDGRRTLLHNRKQGKILCGTLCLLCVSLCKKRKSYTECHGEDTENHRENALCGNMESLNY